MSMPIIQVDQRRNLIDCLIQQFIATNLFSAVETPLVASMTAHE